MIVWINGPFGAGKTTLSEILVKLIPNSVIFDPEHIGYIIHKTVPESRTEDFQNFPMWREHVVLFANNLEQQFGKNLIIPMTLVNPEYIKEIHDGLNSGRSNFHHVFLKLDEKLLRLRIVEQVLVPQDKEKDQEVRQWRLDQVERCLQAIQQMPEQTIFLDSGLLSPEDLAKNIVDILKK